MSIFIDNDNFWIKFPPILQKNFEDLFLNGKIGLLPLTISDISFMKTYTENDFSFYFHYTLKIPFAGNKLSWDLIFTPEDMSFAPNFNFNDDNFYLSEDLDIVMANIPSLVNWNVNNSRGLSSVLKEFLNLYKKQQFETLKTENIYSHISGEYQRLIEDVSPADVELLLTSSTATVMVNIKIDILALPQYVQEIKDTLSNPGEDACLLKISYIKLDGSKINTSVQLSPRLKQVLESVYIPPYSNNPSLIKYVTSVRKSLQEQIESIEQHYKLKKIFINSLCVKYGSNLFEYDAETFTNGTLQVVLDRYYCNIHIEIGKKFPKEKPAVTVQLLYCISLGYTCSEKIDDYPYSPRWAPEAMLQRLMQYLRNVVPKLKSHKH